MCPSAPWTSPTGALSLLETIEQLDEGATGTLVLREHGETLGIVFVQYGMVCWATSRQMSGRLTDLLLSETHGELDRESMESVYEGCRSSGAPLGETLVTIGALSPQGLQQALSIHTAEALMCLASARTDPQWHEHDSSSYDARFVFSPSDIFFEMCALWVGPRAASARTELGAVLPDGVSGIAFDLEDEELPVTYVGRQPFRIHELYDVARWVSSTLDLAAVLDAHQRLLVLNSQDGCGTVLWRRDQLIYVATCIEPSELAYIVAKRRASHPGRG